MGTTEETQEPGEKDNKSFDFHELVDKGKKWAATVVVIVAFLQSLYASYIKEADETVAKDNYAVQAMALEDFSNKVDVRIAEMSGRLGSLEAVCVGVLQPKVADAATPQKTVAAPQTVSPPKGQKKAKLFELPGGMMMSADPGDGVFKIAPEEDFVAPPQAQESLKVRLPDAPWQKKGSEK